MQVQFLRPEPSLAKIEEHCLRGERSVFGTNATQGFVCPQGPWSLKTWRQYQRDASGVIPAFVARDAARGVDARSNSIVVVRVRQRDLSSVAQWQGSRLLTGNVKVRLLPLERSAHCPRRLIVRIAVFQAVYAGAIPAGGTHGL